MAARRRKQARGRRSPRRQAIAAARGLLRRGRATVTALRPSGRARKVASTRRISRLVGRSIPTARRLPARAIHGVNRLARRGRVLTGAIRPRTADRAAAGAASEGRRRRRQPVPAPAKPSARRGRRAVQTQPAGARAASKRGGQRQTAARATKGQRELRQRSIQELRKQAREAGIEGRSSMTKDQLVKVLSSRR